MHTEIPTIIDPSATINYPIAIGSIIVGISVPVRTFFPLDIYKKQHIHIKQKRTHICKRVIPTLTGIKSSVYIYICVCVCVCMYVYMYIRLGACLRVHVCVYMYMYVTRVCACT